MSRPEHNRKVAHLRVPRKLDADVIVVGAGPAGSAAAAWLARAAWKVLLLDRHTFPRDKVCGDFVGPVGLLELEALGISERPEYQTSNVIRRAALHVDGEELISRMIPEVGSLPAYGRCIPRSSLDTWLVDAARTAGVQVLDGATVLGYEVSADAATISTKRAGSEISLRAQLIIGADGSSSAIGRTLRGGPPRGSSRIIAVRGYYVNDAGPEDEADLYFNAESFPGYYWVFPTGNRTANVGIGMVLETYPPSSDHLRDTLLRLTQDDPALHRRLRDASLSGRITGWPLATYDPSLPVLADRVLLVGDAAGFINPLNGEGIQYALLSGRWAAEQAASALESGDLSQQGLQPYGDRVEEALRYDMAFAGAIVECIRNRHLNDLWLKLLKVIAGRARSDERYAEICGAVLAGLVPSHHALTPRVIGRTIDHAVYTAVLTACWASLKGPRHLVGEAAQAAEDFLGIALALSQDPAGSIRWISGVIRQGGELSVQAALSWRSTREAQSCRPTEFARTARISHLEIPFDHVENNALDETLLS